MAQSERKIGPYHLISKIGSGAFGVVWLAEKRSAIATTKVALKLSRDQDIDIDAIKREAGVWVEASGHPNVLPIIDADVYDDQVVIVSEYAPDGSLWKWIEQHGGKAPSIEAAVQMVDGILAGLDHLHARRIIHRDLKPDNILLQRETPRLADFGIARILKTTSHSTVVTGTPAYMAPEAFDGKRDEQTDVWAVGVIFYQLLLGQLPFPQLDMASLLAAIITREPEPLPPFVPVAIERVARKALERTRSQRYGSAAEMRLALREATRLLDSNRYPETRPKPGSIPLTIPSPLQTPSAEAIPPTVPAHVLHPQETIPAPPPTMPVVGEVTAPATQKANRRWVIFAILVGVVLVGIVVGIAVWPGVSSNEGSLSLRSYSFEVPKVDSSGKVVDMQKGQAQSVTEDLGGGVNLEMVKITGGTFQMGLTNDEATEITEEFRRLLLTSNDPEDIKEAGPRAAQMVQPETPAHQVAVPSFYIGKYEITQAQWRAVAKSPKIHRDLKTDPSLFKGDDFPVESVDWDDAVEFCARLSKATGREYRLPTEAEWEYACRAGTRTPFAFGDSITTELVNYRGGSRPFAQAPPGLDRQRPTAVGSLGVANGFGLYDMHGNVTEWCADPYHWDYNGAPSDATPWEVNGDAGRRMARGGSWFNFAIGCSTALRIPIPPDSYSASFGFRVVMIGRSQ